MKIIQALTKKKAAPVTAVSMKNLNILHDSWRGLLLLGAQSNNSGSDGKQNFLKTKKKKGGLKIIIVESIRPSVPKTQIQTRSLFVLL